jgi:hypothetical protein
MQDRREQAQRAQRDRQRQRPVAQAAADGGGAGADKEDHHHSRGRPLVAQQPGQWGEHADQKRAHRPQADEVGIFPLPGLLQPQHDGQEQGHQQMHVGMAQMGEGLGQAGGKCRHSKGLLIQGCRATAANYSPPAGCAGQNYAPAPGFRAVNRRKPPDAALQ